jgi:hypothetical protein
MTDQPMEDRVLVEVTVPAPADQVWATLRDRDRLMQWFGWDTDSLGAEVDWIFFDHAAPDDANKVLNFGGMPDRYEVVADGENTIVRVVRSAPASEDDWNAVYEDMTEGWISFTQQLAFLLARHVGQPRRTIYLSGEPLGDHALNGLTGVGMDDVPAQGGRRRAGCAQRNRLASGPPSGRADRRRMGRWPADRAQSRPQRQMDEGLDQPDPDHLWPRRRRL